MLVGDFLEVSAAEDVNALERLLGSFGARFGFPMLSAAVVVDRNPTDAEFYTIANTPTAFQTQSTDIRNAKRDPVLKRMKRSNVPVLWDQATYAQDDAGDLWDEQAPFGYRTGIAVALHRLDGRHFLLGYSRNDPLPTRERALGRLVADVQLLAVYAQDAAIRLLLPANELGTHINLTPRELEVLRWGAEGKSAWVISKLLSISEHTVVYHTRNAIRKLGCQSKHEAAAKAGRLGLL